MPVQFHFDGAAPEPTLDKVFVAALTNKEGVMLYSGRTEDAVYEQLVPYCDERWSEIAHEGDAQVYDDEAGCFVHIEIPSTCEEAQTFLSPKQLVRLFFTGHPSETLDCEWVAL